MSYAVKEIFLTLQGEGRQAGRRAVFLRFSGCNLWSGRERDRATADCRFCDTDFVGMDGDNGGRYADAQALAARVGELWETGLDRVEGGVPFVVMTGGEPLLQVDDALIAALHDRGFEIAVETNGTIAAPAGIDWICVSPKAGTEIVQRRGNELKIVWPQPGNDHRAMEEWDFDHFLVSPMDGEDRAGTTAAAIAFVLANPRWRLSAQVHKLIGVR
ncbi:7-carboxy-7-deazaguanine synthase [Sphingomonas fennica]|uniref:7-carboxy-7-deazaguanine synthase n=1 Tax=Edaphosphingomonas fennica TaxID=114404 RepID=A0A2T4HQ22_9SPHN|nr:7-carboxy-7-deazaguanine synthase [Sphingomonas fennica]PTD17889.1 7-carboxy-7-deazaguanine synthase [Sphingomonas fennica]